MKFGYQIHPNGAARNGKFFGFEGRSDEIQLIVIHTGEVDPDFDGDDTAAQRLSAFMGNDRHSRVSWHATVDSQTVLHELPTEWTGAHVRNWNARTIGIEIGGRHDQWGRAPVDHTEATIVNLARTVAWICKRHDLPARLVTSLKEAQLGMTGLTAHATLDPERRSDPGPDFPWEQLLEQVQIMLDGSAELLGIGDRGPAVKDAQRQLQDLGYEHFVGVADGIAGPLFDDAVRAFERDQGAAETGLWAEPAPTTALMADIDESFEALGSISIGGSVGAGGANRSRDVSLIKSRLDELGFLITGRSLNHAIRLFQAAKDGSQTIGGKDGRVDPGGDTLAWLNSSNAPRWVHMPAGSASEGFMSRERTQLHDDHGWGTSWLADTLRGAAAHYQREYRRHNPGAPLMWSNDASPKRGGRTPDHSGHQAGMQLDIMLPPGSARSGGFTVNSSGYDRGAARAMLKAFRAQHNVKTIFLNDRRLIDERLCAQSPGHHNHIHVHIEPPAKKLNRNLGSSLEIDWAFIRELEGFSTSGYVPKKDGVVIGQSGVTIGSGFDLGQHDAEYLIGLGAPVRIVHTLRPYFRMRGTTADDYLKAHPLSLQKAEVLLIDELVKADKAEGFVASYGQSSSVAFRSIPAAAQTVVASVLFQYGRTKRVPKFWGYATSQNWRMVIVELRDFGDRFGTRRRKEAAYLERGLRSNEAFAPDSFEALEQFEDFAHTLNPIHDLLETEVVDDDQISVKAGLEAAVGETYEGQHDDAGTNGHDDVGPCEEDEPAVGPDGYPVESDNGESLFC